MRRRSAEGGMEGAKLSLTPTESFARNFRYQDPEEWRQKVEQVPPQIIESPMAHLKVG